jgi:hypothetical protein
MTERADKLHHTNALAHSTTLVQAFFWANHYITQVFQPIPPRFGFQRFLNFTKAKIAVNGRRFVNASVAQFTSSVNGVSLPTD